MADASPSRHNIPSPITFTFLGREYTVQNAIRMVVIICGYILLRGLFLQLSKKYQMAAHEQEIDTAEADATAAIGGDYESDGDSWGSKTRRRQRAAEAIALAEIEKRNLAEENADIDKYLD